MGGLPTACIPGRQILLSQATASSELRNGCVRHFLTQRRDAVQVSLLPRSKLKMAGLAVLLLCTTFWFPASKFPLMLRVVSAITFDQSYANGGSPRPPSFGLPSPFPKAHASQSKPSADQDCVASVIKKIVVQEQGTIIIASSVVTL